MSVLILALSLFLWILIMQYTNIAMSNGPTMHGTMIEAK